MTHILHFTIGPVQGFVAEARRTRDLWAGSLLLSWLSAHAMWAVTNHGGTVSFPEVSDDELFQALDESKRKGATQKSPYIGSVPNRFKAEVPEKFDPKACAEAVQKAWKDLANVVWTVFVKDVANQHGNGTKDIWDRQIRNFWDIAWVKGENPGKGADGAWLDQRKNWRTHYPEYVAERSDPGVTPLRYQEGGDHCQLMGFHQELSGYVRARGEGASQKTFWDALRNYKFASDPTNRKRIGELNLRDNERLCAIALVKRLFPVLAAGDLQKAIGWMPGANEKLDLERWPSVSYIAAVPWLEHVWKFGEAHGVKNACAEYKDKIDGLTKPGIFGETAKGVLGLERFANDFFKLDGHFFHLDAIRSMDLDRFKGNTEDERKAKRDEAEAALKELQEKIAKGFFDRRKARITAAGGDPSTFVKFPPLVASEFYAVVIADGDEIGKNLRGDKGEDDAKIGLAKFTHDVPRIVKARNGVTIYAGGDDVLALLPLDGAIQTAIKLRDAYAGAFAHSQTSWTLSAAIVFAQYKIPFRAVLEEAHRQLDKIAKEKNGRDSLAVAVMKPGGIAFHWVSAWTDASIPGNLDAMARELQDKREFTTGFLYNIRERYEPLYDAGDPNAQPIIDATQFKKFLLAEFRKSDGNKEDAEGLVAQLMTIGFPVRHGKDRAAVKQDRFSFDAGLVMRFLAEQGRWFMEK